MGAARTDAENYAAETLERMAPHGALVRFGRAMDDATDDFDWPYFLDKPWKWSTEYVEWTRRGEPSEGDQTFTEWAIWMDAR